MTRNKFRPIHTFLLVAALAPTLAYASLSQNQIFEIDFMGQMVDHHTRAIEHSNTCLERASRSELIELCRAMIADQKAEIGKMQGWLKSWYGETFGPHRIEHDRVDHEHMQRLSGADFEIQFMEMMVAHHMTAIQSSAECLVRTSHGELTSLCDRMIDTQASEIKKMRGWLCSWHKLCSLHFQRSAMVGKPEARSVP